MNRTLDIHRTFAATAEQMWHKWTTTDGLASWWWRHWPDTTYAVDCRVGGEWRVEAAAQKIAVGGTYQQVAEPSSLDFTWVWTDADSEGPVELVEVRFTPNGDGVRVDVRHSGPWDDASAAENYRQGWEFTLGQLADSLEEARTD